MQNHAQRFALQARTVFGTPAEKLLGR